MAQSYTRQSSFSDGDTITAALFNNEYDQLVNAFTYSSSSASSTGHRHDGTAGHGGNIHTIGDLDFLNKIVADSTNNRWGVFVEVSSAAVEQIRIQDGAIVPVTDNDIDLGTSSLEFKDAYFDGTITTDLLTVSGTTNLDGAIQVDNTITVGVDDTGYDVKFFGDTASAYMLWDTSADDLVLAGAAGLDVAGDIDIDGTSNLDNTDIDGTLAVDGTTISLDATTSLNIDNSNTSNGITIGTATSGVPISIGHSTSEVTVNDNLTVTGTLTLGSGAELTEAELEFLDGITAGTVAASKAVVVDSNKDAASFRNVTLTGELDAATLDISGDADIDGTLEADAYTVDGTALNEYIADTVGAMVSSNTESGITVAYEDGDNTLDFTVGTLNQDTTGTAAVATSVTASANNSTDETVYPVFVDGATGSQGIETDTGFTYNPSSGLLTIAGELDAGSLDISGNADIDGTLEADAYTVDGTALNEYIADTVGAMVGSNTETNITVTYEDGDNTLDFVIGTLNQDTTGTADNITISANNSTDETVYPIFVDGATGSQGAESDTGLTYNPSSGLLTSTLLAGTLNTAAQANITSLGTLTTLTVDNVIVNGTTIGHTSDTDLITLADGNVTIAGELDLTTLDVSGNADIDGTLEADAITVDGTALNEYIADTVGAMVSSNTETNITVTYEDGDNTLDFVVGTLNQDTTGNAATFTATANNSTDETVYPVFVDGATGSQGAETDTGFTYNPSSGLLTIAGELDAGSLDISGNVDIDGVLETDNLTVGGAQGSDGQVLTSTGSGVGWEDASSGATYKTFGTSSIMIGDNATGTIDAADNNTGVGVDIFAALTSGDNNTAVGKSALAANTTGSENIAIGVLALDANTTASANIAVGYAALSANTTGTNNTAIGTGSLELNTTTSGNTAVGTNALEANVADNNTAVGLNALVANTTGASNVAVGAASMDATTTGGSNTAVGAESLGANTTGANNAALGYGALEANTTASNNTAVGSAALAANTTGDTNVAVGYQSMDANTTGTNNVAVGDNTLGANTTAANNTAMGSQALLSNTTGTANVAVGAYVLDASDTADQNTGIGYNALTATTDGGANTAVGSEAMAANTTGASNTAVGYLALDANTTASNNVAVGRQALTANTTGASNTAVGKSALYTNTTASNNTAVGFQALYTSAGASNSALGHNALFNNTTGASNTAIGLSAMENNTTGEQNVAIGKDALEANTTASNNTAVGVEALKVNTTGASLVAVGQGALMANTTANDNTAVGYGALAANTTGTNNTAVGKAALDAVTTGGTNTAVGADAGTALTTGASNVAVGSLALAAATTVSYNTAVGQQALEATTQDYNSGFGWTALEANSTGQYNTGLGAEALRANTTGSNNVAVGYGALGSNTTSSDNTVIGQGAGDLITTGGLNVCIGTMAGDVITTGYRNTIIGQRADASASNASYQIALGEDCISTGASRFTFGSGNGDNRVWNAFGTDASWTRVSDVRYKKDIQDNTDCGLAFINDLRPITYKWKKKSEIDSSLPDYDPTDSEGMAVSTNKMYGLIAQEVKEALDKHNITDFGGWNITEEGAEIQAVSQEMFVHPLIKAVQELSAQVEELKSKIEE